MHTVSNGNWTQGKAEAKIDVSTAGEANLSWGSSNHHSQSQDYRCCVQWFSLVRRQWYGALILRGYSKEPGLAEIVCTLAHC